MKLVGMVSDAHTAIPYCITLHWFPLEVYLFKEGIYVIAAAEEYAHILGKRLVGIGGTGIDEVYKTLTAVIAHENNAMLKHRFPQALMCAEILKHHGFIESVDTGDFEFEDAVGNRERVRIGSVLPNQSAKYVRLEDHLGISTPVLSRQHPEKLYW